MDLGRHGEALAWIKAAAERDQPDALSWGNLGTCYSNLRDYHKAIAAYENAIKLEPTYAMAWFNLGGSYWNAGDQEQAKKVWQEATERFPDDEHVERVRRFVSGPDQET